MLFILVNAFYFGKNAIYYGWLVETKVIYIEYDTMQNESAGQFIRSDQLFANYAAMWWKRDIA